MCAHVMETKFNGNPSNDLWSDEQMAILAMICEVV